MASDRVATLARINRSLAEYIPLNRALGISVVGFEDATAHLKMPYDERLIGNPDTGVLHGGAITILMDACCGAACFMALPRPDTMATLDLRIDYLRAATPGEHVEARAHCYKLTRSVAFVRGMAFNTRDDDPIASATATFMVAPHDRPMRP